VDGAKASRFQAGSTLPILVHNRWAIDPQTLVVLQMRDAAVWMRSLIVALSLWGLSPAVAAADLAQRLVAAVTIGRATEVRDLLVQGADANTTNAAGRPVLVVASVNGNRRTAMALIAAGADVNGVDGAGASPLMSASAFGHAELVDVLLLAGADVNLTDANGRSALARATLAGQAAIAERLKAAGAVEGEPAK
jgi:hypothetical protein